MTKKKHIGFKHVTDRKMFLLMEYSLAEGIAKNEQEYFKKIGFGINNKTNILNGSQSFSIKHLLAAAKLTNVNMNWLFDLESNIKRKESTDPIKRIKDALNEIEQKRKKKQG